MSMTTLQKLEQVLPPEVIASERFLPSCKKKIPHRLRDNGRIYHVDHKDPTAWLSLSECAKLVARFDELVHIGLSCGQSYRGEPDTFYLDVDGVVEGGTVVDWLQEIIDAVAHECYVEYSQSGRGVHILGNGQLPSLLACYKTLLPARSDRAGLKLPEQYNFFDKDHAELKFTNSGYLALSGDAISSGWGMAK